MVTNHDWISWDNSMKAHIDQIEVKWKHDMLEIHKDQTEINQLLADNVADLIREQKRTRAMIAIAFMLVFIDAVLCIACYDALGGF